MDEKTMDEGLCRNCGEHKDDHEFDEQTLKRNLCPSTTYEPASTPAQSQQGERGKVYRLVDELIEKAARQRHDNMPLPPRLLRNYVWNSLGPDLADAVTAAVTAARKEER